MKTAGTLPVPLESVLAAEYAALRPGADFKTTDPRELFRRAHSQEKPLSALCISGGGIRSATFSLGVIQGLAELGILQEFDYLSTVSGGGYIGGWLTAWINRAGGLQKVAPNLRRDAPPPASDEADPIQHLREYNNYLTPKLGAFSGDTWTLAATIIRNIFLNWLVLIPLLMAILMAPRIVLSMFALGASGGDPVWAETVKNSPMVIYGLPYLAAALFTVSMYNTLRYLPGVGNRDHDNGAFTRNVLAPLVLAALCFCGYDALHFLDVDDEPGLVASIEWMLAPCLIGWFGYLAVCGKPWRERLALLAGHLSLAIVLLGIGTALSGYLLTNYLLKPTTWAQYVTIGPPLLLFGFSVAGAVFVGLSSSVLEDEDREWLSRGAARLLLFCAIWLAGCTLVLILPEFIFGWQTWIKGAISSAGAIAAGASSLAGFKGAYTRPGQAASRPKSSLSGVVLKVAPALFTILLIVGLAMLTDSLLTLIWATELVWWKHENLLSHTYWYENVGFAAAFFGLSWLMARFVNINMFSLEGMYRNRLIRAYLGASNPKRAANKFTGFSMTDNFQMHELDPGLKPFHVLNLTLNLVSGDRLAWQQRKAASFTVSPLHSGSLQLGYRDSKQYGGKDGISLGTAVTISGAAASPNMGYHSSPLVGLIMTLFNLRLGAWLGNPGRVGSSAWKDAGPRSAIGSLMKEALGLTSDRSKYVYLSDGGHFENLGLYEMVLRRCHTIVVIDSGCDGDFTYEDLGNALRKIRIDMKIPISFAGDCNVPSAAPTKRCCTATIHYSAVDGQGTDGQLLYIKPMMLGNEPPDVASYHSAHPTFPHQSTAEQWFDESQTESYRMLGLHTADEIFEGWNPGPVEKLRPFVERGYLARPKALAVAQ